MAKQRLMAAPLNEVLKAYDNIGSKPKSPTTPPPVPGQQKQTTQINDHGKVRQCPKCYETVQPGVGVCPNCGHVFVEVGAVSSSKELANGIKHLFEEYNQDIKKFGGEDYREERKKILTEQIIQYIANFPIPFSKEDLMEFIITMDSKRRMDESSYDWRIKEAYASKYKEAVAKAKVLFPTDPQMQTLVKSSSRFSWGLLGFGWKMMIVYAAIAFVGLCIWGGIFLYNKPHVDHAVSLGEEQRDSLIELINNLPQPTTENYKDVEHRLLQITWHNIHCPNDETHIKVNYSIKKDYLECKRNYAKEIESIYMELGKIDEAPKPITYSTTYIDN